MAIVTSRYNGSVTGRLREGAVCAYRERGGSLDHLALLEAPGAYELVAVANAAARDERYAAVVCLGCVIKGETDHDRYINQAVAQGLAAITVATGKPVAFGLLTVGTPAQAEARAGGAKGNKGAEAMNAALDTLGVIRALASNSAIGVVATLDHAPHDKAAH